MDASSPLAAMHPAPPPTWGQSHDIYRSHSHYSNSNPFGSGTLNIRDHLQRSKPDYFSLKSVRGSSPTASLAADLSQNFRIDTEGSPRFPTPRRALFTSNMMGGIENRDYITTPPLPASSSPVPMSVGDMMEMDISPLPHKTLYSNTSIEITSPTPGELPDDDDDDDCMMMESPIALSRPPSMTTLEPPKPLITDSRKRLALRRPSLSRAKGHSASGITGRLHPENHLNAFKFGSEHRVPSGLSLGECFQDSPLNYVGLKPPTAPTLTSHAPHSRRPSNPFQRRPRQYRRSLSMFENPMDVHKPKNEDPVPASTLQSVMDIEDVQDPALPHFFPEGESDSIPRISRETFLDVMDGKYSHEYTQRMVIDCRFEYEYEGGHIDGAINYNDKELLARHLFEQPMEGKVLLIFHCEYSAHRAPLMARHIRSEDRTVNAEHYPHLTYPEVYLLDGGYSEFFIEHPSRCYPQSYVEMNDSEHVMTCEREMGKLQQKRKGLSRARTFAFGARESMVDESPTAPGRCHDSPSSMIGNSPILGADRTTSRRMASY
ncbi:hypothetical protein PG997_003140 [Apiospora hydei]|uniref:M-phase inducer phosphatase n=1 Tax=Apiospora hydei TaxID=1337664 RepID=A0ABR1WYE7_9PEZI